MANLIGRFYFKKGEDGGLQGEYSNNYSSTNGKENSILITPYPSGGFLGEYSTEWMEGGKTVKAKLYITYKGTSKTIYTLLWKNKKGDVIFWGEGFVIDDTLLIGDYRNYDDVLKAPNNL